MVRQLQPWQANLGKRQARRRRSTFGTAVCCMRSHFWAIHTGAELDLLLMKGSRRYGVEVKSQGAPR